MFVAICDLWPIVVNPDCCPGWSDLPQPRKDQAIRLATEVIWALSGRQFQICTACVRPCETFCLFCGPKIDRPGYWGLTYGGAYGAGAAIGGAGAACGCGCESGGCGAGCKSACAVRLDPYPVIDILEVRIGGAVQAANTYQVIDGHILVRAPGAGCWPKCNDLSVPNSVTGGWSVTYSYGTKSSAVALDMASIFACEAAKALCGQKCRLSGRITSVNRDGVSIQLDPKTFLKSGLTSLPEVDQWLTIVNPKGLPNRGEVWSPDVRPPRQLTWPLNTC